MYNPNAQFQQSALISDTVVEAFTTLTVAISGFLALLVFSFA